MNRYHLLKQETVPDSVDGWDKNVKVRYLWIVDKVRDDLVPGIHPFGLIVNIIAEHVSTSWDLAGQYNTYVPHIIL